MHLHRVAIVLAVVSALALSLTAPFATAAKLLEPLVVGWERIFKLDWEVRERRGHPVVDGTLRNDSPYRVTKVQLLIDAIDQQGTIVGQRVVWAGPGEVGPFGHTVFEAAPPKAAAANYRVRVFAYDRVESGDFGAGH